MDQLIFKASNFRLKDYDKDGTVVFVANAFNVEDAQGDITLKGAFQKTIKENFQRWRYLFAHDKNRKIGEPLEAWENEHGLVIKAVLNLNKDDGRNVYEDYKLAAEYGKSVEHSVGVKTVKSRGENPRYVSEFMMVEASYIPLWGANPDTPLLEIKDAGFVQYCIKNGNHTDCYLKKYESLTEPAIKPLQGADEQTIEFLKQLKF